MVKKVKRVTIIMIVGFVLASCIPSEYQMQTHQVTSIHRYELLVKDINDKPIDEVTVNYTVEKEGKVYKQGEFITKSDGKFEVEVSHTITYTNENYYLKTHKFSSDFKYKVSKEGFETTSGSTHISNAAHDRVKVSVVLIKPIDYINPSFIASVTGNLLKYPILKFTEIIISESLLSDAKLKAHSIDLIKFNEKNYLQFEFISNTVYDSLKMNKYDIGKKLFDGIVRKVLSHLDNYISDPRLFDGYDLIVMGFTKDYTDKDALNQTIQYRFMIPQEIVKQYTNKDISEQQVLDCSIIFIDGERKELKL